MTKGDIQYLTRAFANNLTGPNVFTAADIAAVTEQCVALRNRLAGITNDVLETECGNRQQREGGDVKVRT